MIEKSEDADGLRIVCCKKRNIMDKKNKGLADNHDGDFILNESGTSVSNPVEEDEIKKFDEVVPDHQPQEDTEEMSSTDEV